jgi:predicted DNA-binding protein
MARPRKEGSYLNAKLPTEIIERVSAYSEKTRIPKTAIVEMALKEYLDKVDPVEKPKKDK